MQVIIVGGSGGIGTALAERLHASSHQPIIIDQVVPACDERFIVCNASRPGQVDQAVRQAVRQYGWTDALVNSIGIYPMTELARFTWEQLTEVMQVNFRAPVEAILAWHACRSVSSRRGVVVNVASAAGIRGSRDLAYAASKAALIGATRSLARTLADDGVTVVAVAPGLIDTPMSRRMPERRRAGHVEATIPKRAGTPAEVADLIHYVITGNTGYLTGAVLSIDGGLT
jgi:NAD(P)-dependent dehydrogenase (short-subunit alcohol dehydrogenase family)